MSTIIVGLMFMGSVVLFICIASCMQCSVVKRVHIVLSELRMRLFVCVHAYISCKYA